MLTRRRLITGGVGAGAVLAAGAAYGPHLAPEGRDAVIAAVAAVLLDGALPAQAAARARALRGVAGGVERAIAGLPLRAQRELSQLLTLLGFPLTRRLLAGVSEPWHAADPRQVDAFLRAWRHHRLVQLRAAYDALHQLTMAAWYGNPAVWPATGYPGPPRVG
ncbi:hypothetical protein EPN52_03705 [bacterium]|nr:MAG: hypothetical protein EPN52_03705 [bacterium]